MCRSMVDIQSVANEIRRGKKRKIDRKKPQDENIYVRILLCRAAINNTEMDKNSHFDCSKQAAYRSYPDAILSDRKTTIVQNFPTNSVTIWH